MNNNNISIFGLLPRADNLNKKAKTANESLKKMCDNYSMQSINHYPSIKLNQHTNKGKLHLNRKGSSIFEKSFGKFLYNLH